MIDLHMHSTYSDGTFTVEEIIEKAKELGLTQIAITDHNILEGSIKGYHQCNDIDFIIGIELSVGYKGEEVHLLGYFPNVSIFKNVEFIIRESRINKKVALMEMIENLNAMGYDISINELSEFGKGELNRVHICKVLMKHGYINSVQEGFEKLIGEDCKAYVERKVISIEEACEAIHNDDGIAVIAHPYEYTSLNTDEFLNDIMEMIDGIECYHPSATKEQSIHLASIAHMNNKIITGGSDFHGDNKPDIDMNMMSVNDEYKINRY